MKKVILAMVPVVAILTLFSAQLWAQEISLYAGYLNPGKLDLSTIRNDLQIRGTGIYGLRFEADFLKILGIEQDMAFSPRLFDSSLLPPASDLRGFLYSSNLVVNAPLGRFVPYATAGVGLMTPFGSGLKPFNTRFAGNYGAGVKFKRLLGPLGMRFDVRGYTVRNVNHQTFNILEVSGGLLISTGK